jgi:hypothetical protein
VHPRDDHAGQIDSVALAFERRGIGARALRLRIERNAERI